MLDTRSSAASVATLRLPTFWWGGGFPKLFFWVNLPLAILLSRTDHFLQLVLRLRDPLPVVGVDDEDESLRVLEVVPPQRADLVLAAHVPHREADVLVLDRLHVEACEKEHKWVRGQVQTRWPGPQKKSQTAIKTHKKANKAKICY